MGVFVGAAGEIFESLWLHNDGFPKEIHQRVELLSPSRLSSTHLFIRIPPVTDLGQKSEIFVKERRYS